jgi:YesN/AraC family two-component response regulator
MDIKRLRDWTQKLHVLYVEDEQEIQEWTVVFLKHLIDHLSVATNGQEGWDYCEKESFDLVITDLKMPVMDGETMVKKIKTLHPEVVVITMSGISGNEGEANLPSDFFIRKPASTEDFINVLMQIREKGLIPRAGS